MLDKEHMWAQHWGQAYDNVFRIGALVGTRSIPLVVVGTIIPEHFEGYGCEEADSVDIG